MIRYAFPTKLLIENSAVLSLLALQILLYSQRPKLLLNSELQQQGCKEEFSLVFTPELQNEIQTSLLLIFVLLYFGLHGIGGTNEFDKIELLLYFGLHSIGGRNEFDENEFILCDLQTTILFSYLQYKCFCDNINNFTLYKECYDIALLNKKQNKRNDGCHEEIINSYHKELICNYIMLQDERYDNNEFVNFWQIYYDGNNSTQKDNNVSVEEFVQISSFLFHVIDPDDMHEDAEVASISSEEAEDDNFSVDILLREDEILFSCIDEVVSEIGQIISYATTLVDDENGLSSEDRHSSGIIDDENELSSED